MSKASRRPIVVFPILKLRKIGNFILRVRTIALNILNNALIFVAPVPTTAAVTTDVNDLETAQTLAGTRVAGSAAARDLKYDKVLDDVHDWQGYVQSLADNAADEATAISIIQASGFDLKVHGVRIKPLLEAKHGEVSGSVKLIAAAAAKRASYEWQSSSDGITWMDLPPTLQAKTVTDGFAPGRAVFFRFSPILKPGPGNWSAAVSIMVL